VATAANAETDVGRQTLSELLERYLPALRTYLVLGRRLDAHTAEDMLQGFVADRILENNLLARADPQRGRFRNFLLACLHRYAAQQRRRARAKSRAPGDAGGASGLLQWQDDLPHPGTDPRKADTFELAWARQMVHEAAERMRRECEDGSRPDLWALFEGRVLRPAINDTPPLAYEAVIEQFHFGSVAQATNALVTAKRTYARVLRLVVADYVPADEVDEELSRLRTTLARSGTSKN
jgi:RNA polymerase sigma-70 factor (ECF subfamily)